MSELFPVGVGMLELIAETDEGDALLACPQFYETAEGGAAGFDAEERCLPVQVQLAVALILIDSSVADVLLVA